MKSHRITSERVLQTTLMVALGGCAALTVFAGDVPEALPNPPLVVDYVAPSLLETNCALPSLQKCLLRISPLDDAPATPVIAHCTVITAGDRWMNFESEYGITEKEPTSMGRLIQTAKYDLDTVTFGAAETARRLEFSHRVCDSWSSGERYDVPDELRCLVPLFDTLAGGRVKSVVSRHDPETGKVFTGLKYVADFGPK